MTDSKLYEYYAQRDILPTFANFSSAGDLQAHASGRRALFEQKLNLPVHVFRNAELLEFGPDSGENALVFGLWGARLTLAEPNSRALGSIRRYFEIFGLEPQLDRLIEADIEQFNADRLYDFIVAEGFIYTVQPTELWLGILRKFLKPGGFAVISYYERHGGFFELAMKAIHSAGKELLRMSPEGAAHELFGPKWDSINHTRSFKSWVMDVLENPFSRLKYFLDASALIRGAHDADLDVYTSWPGYLDPLSIYWHKTILPRGETLQLALQHIERSRLSFLSGEKLYLTGEMDAVRSIATAIDGLVDSIDRAVDEPFGPASQKAAQSLLELSQNIDAVNILGDPRAIDRLIKVIRATHEIFAAIADGDGSRLRAMTRHSEAFINAWGQPNHFLVLQKRI